MVQSLVLEAEGNQFSIVTLDLLAIDFEEVEEIRRRVCSIGFRPENVMIAASHTHSGPPAIDFGFVKKDKQLAAEIVTKTEEAVRNSFEGLSPALLKTGFTEFPHGVNRRQHTLLRGTKLGVNLRGLVDRQLSCILLEKAHETAMVVCFGCHPVINQNILLTSADYVAGLRQFGISVGIEPVFFLNGALGDVNPYDRENRIPLARAGAATALSFGNEMAREAVKSLPAVAHDADCGLSSASDIVEVALPKLNGGVLDRSLLIQALRVGKSVLVAFPGEIFPQTSLDLRRSIAPHLGIVSCANGYIGYVPPKIEYRRGGYEIEDTPRVFGYHVPEGVAEDLQNVAEKLALRVLQL